MKRSLWRHPSPVGEARKLPSPQEQAPDIAQVLLQCSADEILDLLAAAPAQVLDLRQQRLDAVQTEKLAEVLRSARCPAMGLSLRDAHVDSLTKLIQSNTPCTPLTGLDLRGVTTRKARRLTPRQVRKLQLLFQAEHSRMTSLDISGHHLADDHFKEFKAVLGWIRRCSRMEKLSANECDLGFEALRGLAAILFRTGRHRSALIELNVAGNGHAGEGGGPEEDELHLNDFFESVGRSRSLQVLDITGVVPAGRCLPAILRMLEQCTTLHCLLPDPDAGPSPTADAADTVARIRLQLARNATTRLDRAMAVALCLKSHGLPRDLVALNAKPFLSR